MVEQLAFMKLWQSIGLYVAAILVAAGSVAIVAGVGYTLFPDAFGWVALFHIAGSGAAGYFVTVPFVDAWVFRRLLNGWNKFREEK